MMEWLAEQADKFYMVFIEKDRYMAYLKGFGKTLEVSFFAVLLGVLIGTLIAIIKVSARDKKGLKPLEWLCNIYITIIRGTPVYVQLLILWFLIMNSRDSSPIMAAVIGFGINSSAYVAEIVRAGILAVDKGQTEAGRSLGLNSAMTMRYIILPQAVKNILPALGNEMITLLKDTSLVSVIALRDVTKQAQNIVSNTYQAYVPYVSLAIIYLVLVIILTKLLGIFERRLRESDRR